MSEPISHELSWCGDNFRDKRLISSCTMYTCVLWVPSAAYCFMFLNRYRITSLYLHFGNLDNKTGVLLFLMQLLCVVQAILSMLLYFSSDETALVLLLVCSMQALSWVLCAVITTRECWRLTRWPGRPTIWFLWASVCTGILELLTANNDAIVYSSHMVKCSVGLTAISMLLLAVMQSKEHLYTSRENERMELDRVSVEIDEGNYPRHESFSSQHSSSSNSNGGHAGARGFFSLSNPILNSSMFRHLLGNRNDDHRKYRGGSSGGMSMKSWNAGDIDDGYAVVDTDEHWGGGRRNSEDDGQSVVLSALDRHTTLSEYFPPRDTAGGEHSKSSGGGSVVDEEDENEWVTLSGTTGGDFLHDRGAGSPSLPLSSPPLLGQSQAVKRAMQSQNARIATAGAASTAAPSRNKGRNLAIPNPAAVPASSAWATKEQNMELNTDYYTIAATKWGLRRHRLGDGEGNGESSEVFLGEDDTDEIEFEIAVHVSFAKSNSSQSGAGDWTARANTIDSAGGAGAAGGGGAATEKKVDEKWSVWRTGAEIMSLHSQILIAHGDSAAPRRPKLRSLQPPRVNPAASANIQKQSSRSISTDRISSDRGSPLNFMRSLEEAQVTGATGSTLASAAEAQGAGSQEQGQGQMASQADVLADMRSITLYLTAVLAISNKSANGPSSAGGTGGSVGVPVGGLGAIYPALLLFLEIYVGGGSLHRSAQDDYDVSTRNSFIGDSPRSEQQSHHTTSRSSFGALSAEDAAALRGIAEEAANDDDNDKENWRKLFNKLKSKVVLQDQCVRCRLFRRVVRASDVFNYLQVSNDGFLKEEEALSMGRKLIQCGLLRAVTVGFHGPSQIQYAAISRIANMKESDMYAHRLSIINVWAESSKELDEKALKESLHPSGALDADAALLFANSPDYLYFFPDESDVPISDNPQDRFEVIGGSGIEATVTTIDTTTDSSVRYCISLKHLAPTPAEPVDRKYNSSGSDRWTVWKRYSDFDKLHSQLLALYLTPPASLPPKTLSMSIVTSGIASVGTSAATAVGILPKPAADPQANARRDGLQHYLREVIEYILHTAGEDLMRGSESGSSSMDGILFLGGFLDHDLASSKMNALIEARLLLARFLDVQHDQLTIR